MKFDRTGIILYVLKYDECIDFYTNILGLETMFLSENLTCYKFGGSYLMVELDDEYDKEGAEEGRIRTCLRMNVSNIKELADKLKSKGVDVDYQEHSWGIFAKFFDPDGNLCALKDSQKFDLQVLNAES